jgi:hypothetical protein
VYVKINGSGVNSALRSDLAGDPKARQAAADAAWPRRGRASLGRN